jgi:acetyltransferase EpsM
MKKIAILGCGGHSKVVVDIIYEIGNYEIIGIYDDYKEGFFETIPILGKITDITNSKIDIDCYIIAIGNDLVRKNIYEKYITLNWEILIHPKSTISKKTKIDVGTIICAGVIIQPDVNIGKHCIINTGSSIDHESKIGDFTSICPKATICGQVTIGSSSFIGANSTIIQCLNIGQNCIIGAGSVIIRNIENNCKVVGNPGKLLK